MSESGFKGSFSLAAWGHLSESGFTGFWDFQDFLRWQLGGICLNQDLQDFRICRMFCAVSYYNQSSRRHNCVKQHSQNSHH
jgi:hypothetical protein